MKTECGDVHGAAIGIVGGIADPLAVGRQPDALAYRKTVIALEEGFRPIAQRAVTDEEGNAAG
jgi:hypothetical protein